MPPLFSFLAGAALFTLVSASSNTLTAAPAHRSPTHHELAQRQASTYETTSPLPLTDYSYPYSAIPYQVNPYAIGRGPQSGYNICNSTTEGDSSQCQTMVVNSLADFCLWGSPIANETIGDVEAAVVAYCSQKGHGTRVMPPGTITGAQFMKTSAYIQVVGRFKQSGIGLASDDFGGELDPHGADLLGNPIGGLLYSNGMPSAKDNSTYMQVSSWNNFVGSGIFCIKLCDPTVPSPNYCENRYDLIGCSYNMPAAYTDGEFTSCEGELQDVVGVYTSNGQTYTWSQPDPLPATSTLPWTPRIPASSNCVTHKSEELFGAASSSASSSGASATVTGTGTKATGSSGTNTRTGSSSGASATTTSNAAGRVTISSGVLAIVTGAFFALA